MNERWLTKPQIAEHLGCSVSTVDRLVDKGMPSVKFDDSQQGARRFLVSDVDEWMRKHGNGAGAAEVAS